MSRSPWEIVYPCIAVLFVGLIWATYSYFEARAYERLTGQEVSTLDAMFIQLRVQEPIRKEK